ncbi:hypothetical protein [Holospora curviuscula]|nr:hypothetical protein [Holospora curviuscula]
MENFDFKTLWVDKDYDADYSVHYAAGSNKAVTPPTIYAKNSRNI